MQSRPSDQAGPSGDRARATVTGAEATTIGGPSNTSATNLASGIILFTFRPGCGAEV
jgi:hypothetical protein